MLQRRRKSGGQALVLVTLALFAMGGMMGLAVDLGWSFFVQKQAQTVADGAALAAVHEGWVRLGGSVSSVSCPNSSGRLYCETSAPTACDNLSGGQSSNLYNGCLYAVNNGFDYASNSNIRVTVQANIGSAALPTTPTGGSLNIPNVKYWATYRATQAIPQLFSSLLGNTQGIVSAVATAGIVAQVIPGSFYGLNQVGDCATNYSGAASLLNSPSQLAKCGVDIDVAGAGATCAGAAVAAVLCAPNGVFMASKCNHGSSNTYAGCADPGSSNQNYAGNTTNVAKVWSNTSIRIAGDGTVNNTTNFIPTATNGASTGTTGDPYVGRTQPPVTAPSNTGTCVITMRDNSSGLSGGSAADPILLGPYQYYVKIVNNQDQFVRWGDPLTIGNGAHVRFTSTNVCATTASGSLASGIRSAQPSGTPATGSFPSTVFWGGLSISGNTNTTVDFTDGQYVMAGTTSLSGSSFKVSAGAVTCSTCSGGGSAGTMFITTDDTYIGTTNGLTKPVDLSGTTFYQGNVSIKNATVQLSGFNAANGPAALADYDNMLFWQDRRNSTDTYDSTGHVTAQAQTSLPPVANHVTLTSPAFITDNGGATSLFKGVIHQPRGSWVQFDPGSGAVSRSPLQVFTGAFISTNGAGASAMTLIAVTDPVIVYKTSLIQ